jgi:hypothetical protein
MIRPFPRRIFLTDGCCAFHRFRRDGFEDFSALTADSNRGADFEPLVSNVADVGRCAFG